ncbi:unnamed protein product [Rotaria sordida]|uniref:DDE-1 domain-containing protein n=1 Tax=Rotaria sordida TaxID=392033 RepID=A0A819MPP9_9BILA|nr:unnamed protein product [Rotaria sordida]CAF1438050.1 unnamed protein product [Rotaria sordida]CAF1450400.1 unnamed protein product [Rotaria sordida]CAF3960054.1 unnamed protein product [Rotaria sordida]CAF3984283.1 unnamed protein product [Rotaria sordida]
MKKQKRHILLFLDNAPVHPQDVQLENIKLKFFPVNTTARIQPLDQGIIRAFKAYYRRNLVKHIIASGGVAVTADDINITALDAVYWIQNAWDAVTETTIRNTFKSAGFETRPTVNDMLQGVFITNEIICTDDKSIEELDRVLKHLTIGGKSMSGYDYVGIDDNAPSFNEWNEPADKLLSINGITNEDADSNEDQQNDDLPSEEPPSLSECLHLVRRLRLFSTMQQPDLHSFIIQLQSKLTDALLDSSLSKQRSITDYFKYSPVEVHKNLMK